MQPNPKTFKTMTTFQKFINPTLAQLGDLSTEADHMPEFPEAIPCFKIKINGEVAYYDIFWLRDHYLETPTKDFQEIEEIELITLSESQFNNIFA